VGIPDFHELLPSLEFFEGFKGLSVLVLVKVGAKIEGNGDVGHRKLGFVKTFFNDLFCDLLELLRVLCDEGAEYVVKADHVIV